MRVTSARRRSLRRPGAGALAARVFDPQELTLPVPSTFLLWGSLRHLGGPDATVGRQRPPWGPPGGPRARAPPTWRKTRPMPLSSCGSCCGRYWMTARYASTAST